jgi:hypothetical protein
VLAAVGSAPCGKRHRQKLDEVLIHINQEELRYDLIWARGMFSHAHKNRPGISNRKKKMARHWPAIGRNALHLLNLISKTNEGDWVRFKQSYGLSQPDPRSILERIALTAEKMLPLPWDEPISWLVKRSAVDHFIEQLLVVFKVHFPNVSLYTKSSTAKWALDDQAEEADGGKSKDDGPFIRFAKEVLRQCGITTIKTSTIAAAVRNAHWTDDEGRSLSRRAQAR